MTKANKTGFQKGNNANPNGRPKGAVNESTKRFARFKTLASEKYEEAFAMLWTNMQAGEGWAHQIYFKELVPKKVHQQTIMIANDDGENRPEAVIKALPQFEELTHDEALNEIKTFKNIEQQDELAKPQVNIFEKLSDERGKQLHLWLNE